MTFSKMFSETKCAVGCVLKKVDLSVRAKVPNSTAGGAGRGGDK